ncbi:Transcription initiation factor IIF, beta subunit [Trifolium repens]|nr:Transcription initiation factor IIF, beta subunit [Trifolium repens]
MKEEVEEIGGGTKEKSGGGGRTGGIGGYVDTSKALNPIWLMKCPPVVAQSLGALPSSSDPSLPSAKVIVSIDPLNSNNDAQFTMELGGNEGGNASRSFAMDMSKDFIPMTVFSDSTQGKVSVEGKIVNKFDMRPHNQNLELYGKLCRERTKKYTVKNRQIRGWSVFQLLDLLKRRKLLGEEQKLREQEEIIFKLFERQPNWSLRNLIQETDQPEQFLKDILKDLCVYNNKGTNQGTYELKPEYRKAGD